MAETTVAQPTRSPGTMIVDGVWRFFCSVRAAMYEIVFLALLVLMGTLKGSIIPAQIPKYVPVLEPLVKRWYAFDVFHSLIFSVTLALLTIAIVVCTLNRTPGIWRSIAHPTVRTSRHFFQNADPSVILNTAETRDAATVALVGILKRRRYRVLTAQRGEETHVYADKHRFGKLGTFPFHLALIMILIGGIVGSELGFREPEFAVPEGESRTVGRGTGLSVELERFRDNYSQFGAPTEYRSDLILYDGDREVQRQSIDVNHPLTYNGVTFYQSAFGQAASMRVTDSRGAVYEETVPFLWRSATNSDAPAGVMALPTQGVQLELFFPNLSLNNTPEVNGIKLYPGQVHAQVRDSPTNQLIGQGAVINQGDAVTIGGLNIEFERERRYTLLQVAYNPGIPILFAASVLLVLGLAITFYFPHRRVQGLITTAQGQSEILLAPLSRRDWGGKRDFARTLDVIEKRLGAARPHGRHAHGTH